LLAHPAVRCRNTSAQQSGAAEFSNQTPDAGVYGVGIAIGGTLLPGLVKELFPPQRAGLVTGLYMFAMMGGATASSALAVPLRDRLGSWEGSLASWLR
jgi:cyanate permease